MAMVLRLTGCMEGENPHKGKWRAVACLATALFLYLAVSNQGVSAENLATETLAAVQPSPPPMTTLDAKYLPDPIGAPSLDGLESIPSNFNRAMQLLPAAVPPSAAPDVVGAFRFICQPSHLNYDDPIAYPGMIGGSPHLHQWFGNTLANGKSTYKTLRTAGDSSCMGPLNRSAYWQPAMIDQDNMVVQPDYISIYYKRRAKSDPQCRIMGTACIGIPRGLRFIFGYDMNRMHKPQPENQNFSYKCVTPKWADRGAKVKRLDQLECLPGDSIMINLASPECWDGKNLDSVDHRSHLANAGYGNTGVYRCPITHPYVIPQFTLGASYTVLPDDNFRTWYLSSDRMPGMLPLPNGSTFHADWYGAWDSETQATWESNCLDKLLNCSDGILGNGTIMRRPAGFGLKAGQRLKIPVRP
ncbi:DUF1996 domain-containing protein [Sphingorhabdus sp.]|uniref:DUF1996 domain-containing protein n=1 Tax=Sphingorhabdus sp. TaxID=1902408 RepID=UPI00391BFE9F